MSKPRKSIPLKTKLAAALLTVVRPNEAGELVPVIDYETGKRMSEDAVLAAFEWDHYPVAVHQGGKDVHHNLVPRPVKEHRAKTAKIDTPAAAKSARLSEEQEAFRNKMLAKAGQGWATEPPKKKAKKAWKPPNSKWDWRAKRWVRLEEPENAE